MSGKNVVVVTESFESDGVYRVFKNILANRITQDITARSMKMILGDETEIQFFCDKQHGDTFRGYSKIIDVLILCGNHLSGEIIEPLIYKTKISQGEIILL